MKIFSRDKRINLRKQFYEALTYVKESKNYIYFTIIFFFAFCFVGFVFASKLGVLDVVLRTIIDRTSGLNGHEMIFFILQNNLMACFFGFISGIFLGIPSIVILLSNGILVGYVMEKVVSIEGWFSIWKLFPHGIFELPAVFISIALGMKLGLALVGGNKFKTFWNRLYKGANVFLFVVVPLLIVAAVIEGLLIAFLG